MTDFDGKDLGQRFADVTLQASQYNYLDVFGMGESNEVSYQTTGGGFETVISRPMADGEAIYGQLEIAVKEDVGYGASSMQISYTAVGDGATARANSSRVSNDPVLANGLRARIEPNGSNIEVQVKGIVGRTFNWDIRQNQGGTV